MGYCVGNSGNLLWVIVWEIVGICYVFCVGYVGNLL
jgi:hypothetical protein